VIAEQTPCHAKRPDLQPRAPESTASLTAFGVEAVSAAQPCHNGGAWGPSTPDRPPGAHPVAL